MNHRIPHYCYYIMKIKKEYDILNNKRMIKMIKLIACDLDETLLNKAKEISDEDVKAISYARQQGVRFVVATG